MDRIAGRTAEYNVASTTCIDRVVATNIRGSTFDNIQSSFVVEAGCSTVTQDNVNLGVTCGVRSGINRVTGQS